MPAINKVDCLMILMEKTDFEKYNIFKQLISEQQTSCVSYLSGPSIKIVRQP